MREGSRSTASINPSSTILRRMPLSFTLEREKTLMTTAIDPPSLRVYSICYSHAMSAPNLTDVPYRQRGSV